MATIALLSEAILSDNLALVFDLYNGVAGIAQEKIDAELGN